MSENIFLELHHIVDYVVISKNCDIRINSFVKIGYINKARNIYSQSLAVTDTLSVEYLTNKFMILKEISDNYKEEQFNMQLLDNPISIEFSPYASSQIVHEIFGHPFESDMVYSYIINNKLKFPNFISISDKTKLNGSNLMEFDDEGNPCRSINQLVENGNIVGKINTVRRSRYDNKQMIRMNYLDFESKCYSECTLNNRYYVFELIGGCVDVLNSCVYLFPQEILDVTKKIKYSTKNYALKIEVKKLGGSIIWAGNDSEIFQSYCVKNGSPIIVFTKSPSLVIDSNTIIERSEIY